MLGGDSAAAFAFIQAPQTPIGLQFDGCLERLRCRFRTSFSIATPNGRDS